MNSSLELFLSNFSLLAYCVALAFTALGCRRIRAAGGDKSFGIATVIALAYLVLSGCVFLADWLIYFSGHFSLGHEYLSQVVSWSNFAYQTAGYLLLLFTAVFATGCIRSARRLPRKPA